VGLLSAVTSRYPIGTNVFDRDWDILAILDTCRVDALRESSKELNWFPTGDINSMLSVGSGSAEWMAHTFTKEYEQQIKNTVYIVCNGFARKTFYEGYRPCDDSQLSLANWDTVSADTFKHIHCVFDDVPFIQPGGVTTDPKVLTDRAVDAIDRFSPDRVIVHYHRPHHPYVAQALCDGRESLKPHEEEPFKSKKQGAVERNQIWDLYMKDLKQVLNEVKSLKEYTTGTLAVSADHGEAFGEFGFHDHATGIFHPKVRKVPWVTMQGDGRDSQYQIEYPLLKKETSYDGSGIDPKERLRQLGYL
jgi:hypothetical protein